MVGRRNIARSHTHIIIKSGKCAAVQTFTPVGSDVGPDVTCIPQKNSDTSPGEGESQRYRPCILFSDISILDYLLNSKTHESR